MGEFDVGGVVAGLAGPAGFGPELRAGREHGAGELGLVVGVRVGGARVAGQERHHFGTTGGGDALAGGDRGEEARRGVGREHVALRFEEADGLGLAAVGTVAPGFLVGEHAGVAERGEVARDGVAVVEPGFDFGVGEFRAAGGAGEEVDDVVRGVVGGIDDHVPHRATQFGGVGEFAVLEPAVGGGEVEEFDDAGGVDRDVAAVAGAGRGGGGGRREVDEGEGELGGEEFRCGELGEGGLHGAVDERLERGGGERSHGRSKEHSGGEGEASHGRGGSRTSPEASFSRRRAVRRARSPMLPRRTNSSAL